MWKGTTHRLSHLPPTLPSVPGPAQVPPGARRERARAGGEEPQVWKWKTGGKCPQIAVYCNYLSRAPSWLELRPHPLTSPEPPPGPAASVGTVGAQPSCLHPLRPFHHHGPSSGAPLCRLSCPLAFPPVPDRGLSRKCTWMGQRGLGRDPSLGGPDLSPRSGLTCPSQRPVWAGVCPCACVVSRSRSCGGVRATVADPGRLFQSMPHLPPSKWGGPLAIMNPVSQDCFLSYLGS